jgi:secreted protein
MTCQLSKAVFGDKIGTAAWHEEPSFYLLTKDDHALAHEVQQRFAKQINAKAKT